MAKKWVCLPNFAIGSAYAPSTNYSHFAKHLTIERAVNKILYEERCIKAEQTYFELLYINAFSSPVKVSKIVFPG